MCDTGLLGDDLRELVLGINCDPENFSCIQLLRVIIQLSSLNLEFICIAVFSKAQMSSCNFALWHFYSYQVMIVCV